MSEVICPHCGSNQTWKRGIYRLSDGKYQKRKCYICNKIFKGELLEAGCFRQPRKSRAKKKTEKLKSEEPLKPKLKPVNIKNIEKVPCFCCTELFCKPQYCERLSKHLKTPAIFEIPAEVLEMEFQEVIV